MRGSRERTTEVALPNSITVLVQACQPFPLVMDNDLYRRFTYVHLADYLALIRLMACQKGTFLAIDTAHLTALCYIIGAALYSGP
jgi:hypothetical protein